MLNTSASYWLFKTSFSPSTKSIYFSKGFYECSASNLRNLTFEEVLKKAPSYMLEEFGKNKQILQTVNGFMLHQVENLELPGKKAKFFFAAHEDALLTPAAAQEILGPLQFKGTPLRYFPNAEAFVAQKTPDGDYMLIPLDSNDRVILMNGSNNDGKLLYPHL